MGRASTFPASSLSIPYLWNRDYILYEPKQPVAVTFCNIVVFFNSTLLWFDRVIGRRAVRLRFIIGTGP